MDADHLWPLLDTPSSFTLFIAPPAWGKTRLLLRLYEKRRPRPMVFLSPLRALADQFYRDCRCSLKKSQGAKVAKLAAMGNQDRDREGILRRFGKGEVDFLILTPEMATSSFLHLASIMTPPPLFVLDEFHLFYLWGHTFRPRIWEMAMGISCLGAPLLGLTATFSDTLKDMWRRDFKVAMDHLFVIDLGNQTFQYPPEKVVCFPGFLRRTFTRLFLRELFKDVRGTILFFCRYRHQVDQWLDFCHRHGIEALGCKGGETPFFSQALTAMPWPRCIFATMALSHGVNLPPITKVFISYRVENLDFWIQMCARGGRQGQAYHVYTFDSFFKDFDHLKQRRKSVWQVFLGDLIASSFFR